MKHCQTCRHVIRWCGASHDLCRTHAPCARGFQYYASDCDICERLWETAADVSNLDAGEFFHGASMFWFVVCVIALIIYSFCIIYCDIGGFVTLAVVLYASILLQLLTPSIRSASG